MRLGLTEVRAALLCMAAAQAPSSAHAQTSESEVPEPLPVEVEYVAHPSCPLRDEFETLLKSRAPRVQTSNPAKVANALKLRVRVELQAQADGRFGGTVGILLQEQLRDRRDFVAQECLEVARAVALSTAFVLEHLALETKPTPPETPPPNPPKRTQPERPTTQQRIHPAPALNVTAAGAPVAALVLDNPLMIGVGGWLGVHGSRLGRSSAHLGLLGTASVGRESRAEFRWLVGDLQLCPYTLGHTLQTTLCAQFIFGAIQSEGTNIDRPRLVTRSWFGLGPSLRARANLSDHTGLLASLAAHLPLAWRHFVFEGPRQPIANTQAIGWLISLGVEHTLGGG